MRTLFLLLLAACSATPDPETLPSTASDAPAPPDLAAVMEQAHFAFRADDTGRIVGGHGTYEAAVSSDGTVLRTRHPDTDGEASLTVSTRGVFGVAVVAEDGHITRDGGGGVIEHLQNTADGLSQSWTVASDPGGAFLVDVQLDGLAYVGETASGLHFADDTGLGFVYGHGTWIDADGDETPVPSVWTGDHVQLEVPAEVVAASTFPAVLDPVIGPEVAVDEPIPSAPLHPANDYAVCSDGSDWLVVWNGRRGISTSDLRIFAAFVAADGSVTQGFGIELAVTGWFPACAWEGTKYAVGWVSDDRQQIFGTFLRADGVREDVDMRFLPRFEGNTMGPLAIAAQGTTTLWAWKERRSNDQAVITVAPANRDGERFGATEPALASPLADSVDLAPLGSDAYLLVFDGLAVDARYQRPMAMRLNTVGQLIDAAPIPLAEEGYRARVAAGGSDQALVVWQDFQQSGDSGHRSHQIRATRFSRSGVVANPDGLIIGARAELFGRFDVGWSGDNWLAVWQSQLTRGVMGTQVSAFNGAPRHPDGIDFGGGLGGSVSTIRVAGAADDLLVVWRGPVGVRVNASGVPLDDGNTPVVIGRDPNQQVMSAVAAGDDGWFVVWSDTRNATTGSYMGVMLGSDGMPRTDAFLVATVEDRQNHVLAPDVVWDGEHYVMVFAENNSFSSSSCQHRLVWVSASGEVVRNVPIGDRASCRTRADRFPAIGGRNGAGTVFLGPSDGRIVSFDGDGNAVGDVIEYRNGNGVAMTNTPTGFLAVSDCPQGKCTWVEGPEGPVVADTAPRGFYTSGLLSLAEWPGGYMLFHTRPEADGGVGLYRQELSSAGAFTGDSTPVDIGVLGFDIMSHRAAWLDGQWVHVFTLPRIDSGEYSLDIVVVRELDDGIERTVLGSDPFGSFYWRYLDAAKGRTGLLVSYVASVDGVPRIVTRLIDSRLEAGATCTDALDCLSGSCSDGVCCDAACDSECDSCTAALTGGDDGTCLPTLAGATCGDDADNSCTAPDTCDGAGACVPNDQPDDTVCGDDRLDCVLADTCQSGVCVDGGFSNIGATCGDDTDDACTAPDTCDGSGSCLANHVPDDTVCGDDGVECVVADTCQAGSCVDSGFIAEGAACGDSTDDVCTDPDTCDGSGTCQPNHEPVQTVCGDDGIACVQADTCDGDGACVDNGFTAAGVACGDDASGACTNPDVCDGEGSCDPNHVDDGMACTGGTFCLSDDSCFDGECVEGDVPTCDPEDVCFEGTQTCILACGDGVLRSDEACDDGLANSDTEPDACRTDCTEPTCGDSVTDTDEDCDDGDDNSDTEADACREDCTEPTCGDGVVDAGEGCDEGDANSDAPDATCRLDCALATCGDGILDSDEACDDGVNNRDESDACRTTCAIPTCGDGIVDTDETCDDGVSNSDTAADACRTDCAPARCGDGVVDAGEECDGGDDCTSACEQEEEPDTEADTEADSDPGTDTDPGTDAEPDTDADAGTDAPTDTSDDVQPSSGGCVTGGAAPVPFGALLAVLLLLPTRRRRVA